MKPAFQPGSGFLPELAARTTEIGQRLPSELEIRDGIIQIGAWLDKFDGGRPWGDDRAQIQRWIAHPLEFVKVRSKWDRQMWIRKRRQDGMGEDELQAALADIDLSMAERRASADRERFTQ